MSIEALAMAGVDYIKSGIDLEEVERGDNEKTAPQHLLAVEHKAGQVVAGESDEKWQVDTTIGACAESVASSAEKSEASI
ncbi:hypothetical protein SLA2020_083020 [Shorea laevis]